MCYNNNMDKNTAKFKRGFTLAEVLITLGLIGVVAAITLPALNSDIRAQQIGPSLAKAVNTQIIIE